MKPEELKDRAEALATRMVEMMHGNYGMLDIVDELLTALQQAVDARWVFVEEGLPDLPTNVLVYGRYRNHEPYVMSGISWNGTEWEPHEDDAACPTVLAWYPFPEPPAIRAGKQTVQEEGEGV